MNEITGVNQSLLNLSLRSMQNWLPKKTRLAKTYPLMFQTGCGLTKVERDTLTRIIHAIQSQLSLPAEQEQISKMLAILFHALKAKTLFNNVKVISSVYKMILSDFPIEILSLAIDDIVFGRADGLSLTCVPSTAELCQYCERLEERIRASISYVQNLLNAPEEEKRNPISPERMAELKCDFFQNWKTQHALCDMSERRN